MLKKLLLQAFVFFVIFHGISWLRELTLLDTDGSIAVPNLAVQQIDGNSVNLADYKGKPVVYYFWAPWCSVCKMSMPNLQDFHLENKDKVHVVAVALSYDSKDEVVAYMEENDFSFDYVLGNVMVSQAFKIQGYPTYYVADKDGMLVSKSMGYTSELGMQIRSSIL